MNFEISSWDEKEYNRLVLYLESIAEPKYRDFHKSLVPNLESLLGIRVPILKKLAKEIVKGDYKQFILIAGDKYYEEKLLKGLVIAFCKQNQKAIFTYLKDFVPLIDNWAICDTVCSALKFSLKPNKDLFEFVLSYLKSQKEFEIRFAVVMLLNFFINDEYIDLVLKHYDLIKHDGYYIKMAVAWGISVCFVKHKNKTMAYLLNNNLDDFTYNKSLQKIIESNRVAISTKDTIKSMKR